ncbi:MAG: hypothetical protein ACXQS8_02230 [Candidatus Helarchaeales archaeon]
MINKISRFANKNEERESIQRALPPPFHWFPVKNIDNEEIPYMAEQVGIKLEPYFHVKSNWSIYKQYDVFNVDGKPILHIKKCMSGVYFEAIGLHLGRILDPELLPDNYLVGTYNVGFFKWKEPIPYVLTTYVHGKTLKKKDIPDHYFDLGRQFIFHKILELHDVYERHFIKSQGVLKRVDFDLSFRELQGRYTGFDRWIKKYKLFDQIPFIRGMDFEIKKIQQNLSDNEDDFKQLLKAMKKFSEEEKDEKYIKEFYGNLLKYWERNCSEIFQKTDLIY